jgi:hypothetical protein
MAVQNDHGWPGHSVIVRFVGISCIGSRAVDFESKTSYGLRMSLHELGVAMPLLWNGQPYRTDA